MRTRLICIGSVRRNCALFSFGGGQQGYWVNWRGQRQGVAWETGATKPAAMPSKSGDSVAKDVTGIQKRLSYFMLIGCKLSLLALNQLVYGSSPYRGTISKPAALAAGFVVYASSLIPPAHWITVCHACPACRSTCWRVACGHWRGANNLARFIPTYLPAA